LEYIEGETKFQAGVSTLRKVIVPTARYPLH